jgi:hypothetical protein
LAGHDSLHRLTVEYRVGEKALRNPDIDLMITLPSRTRAAQVRPGVFVE